MQKNGYLYVPMLLVAAALMVGVLSYGTVRYIKIKNVASSPAAITETSAPPQAEPQTVPSPPSDFLSQELRQAVPGTNTVSVSLPVTNGLQKICTGLQMSSWDCYETYYVSTVQNNGIRAAFADIRARYDKDAYVKSQCHPLTHVIGREAAEKFPDPAAAYKEGDSFCWSGYYHGVLEWIIGRIGMKNLSGQLDTICSNLPDKKEYGFNYYNCVHGLGHGLMAITQDELFETFTYCDKLTGYWEQISCASGAYMENIIQDGKNHKTKYLRPDEPLYPCTESPEKYKNTCYAMQTSYMLKVNGRSFPQTFTWCGEVEVAYRNTCYESIGRDASGGSISDMVKTRDICLLGPDSDARAHCVIGAVKDFISYYHSDAQAKEFCASFSETPFQETCLATAKEYYKSF